MQEVSSIDGRVLDSWALHKPAGWQPNLLARAIAQQLFISNYTNGSWIEDPGAQSCARVLRASEKLRTLSTDTCVRQAFRRKAISWCTSLYLLRLRAIPPFYRPWVAFRTRRGCSPTLSTAWTPSSTVRPQPHACRYYTAVWHAASRVRVVRCIDILLAHTNLDRNRLL